MVATIVWPNKGICVVLLLEFSVWTVVHGAYIYTV